MNIKREIALTGACLGISLVSFSAFTAGLAELFPHLSVRYAAEDLAFLVIVSLLMWGNIAYQIARLGFLQRRRVHCPLPCSSLDAVYDRRVPSLAILIPSYNEEVRVLRQTVLSAALVQYPDRRVVVLIDDPPNATGRQRVALDATRRMIRELNDDFASRACELEEEYRRFLARMRNGELKLNAEADRIGRLYEELADWIEALGAGFNATCSPEFAHTDGLWTDIVLTAPAADHRSRALRLRARPPGVDRIAHEYRRIAALLKTEIRSFERKGYANLSHQPNKAMNLNSYIGLIGHSFREQQGKDGTELVECESREATFSAPYADYLMTLDADSFVCSDYALRLIRIMDENPRVAVAQTPYSAVPRAPRMIERIAGATTDIQYIIHQGFTRFDATYWVGANAMLRLAALADIRVKVEERGYPVSVFVQDRTVIEDTGSTVDLVRRGWQLYNYPERLAYSATPPDFGALIVQRRRWSNGGLLILGDLIRYLIEHRRYLTWRGLTEALMRAYYLCSPAVGSLGFLTILLYPWNNDLTSAWLPLTAVPYYFLYGRDLCLAKYRWRDLLRVYALNLMLLPVNLAGVMRSLQQAATGRKAAFGRTPKVRERTTSPPVHIVFQWMMLAYLLTNVLVDTLMKRYPNAGFALMNAVLYVYAITRFLGWQECWLDFTEGLRRRWPAFRRVQVVANRQFQQFPPG